MTIENLIKAVAPPAAPFEAFEGPWAPIEAELGVTLPLDYKDFVRLYGGGSFMGFLGIAVPRCRYLGVRLEHYVPEVSRGFLALRDAPYTFWPSPGGLLPFGSTDTADYLFWLTVGPPETWRTVVWDRGSPAGFEVFDCDLTDFLAGLATGGIAPEAFPDDLVVCDQLFEPYSDASAQEAPP